MPDSKKIRVMLVDDHRIVRQGMRRLLELDDGISVVGEANSGDEAVALAASVCPNVILMDIRIPGLDGIEATRRVRAANPTIEVIMLTSYADAYLSDAIEAGASGYLLKSVGYEELRHAIRVVCSGGTALDPSLGRELFTRFGELSRSTKGPTLSDRELDILRLLASGTNGKDMSKRLFISETTLKREFRHIFDKLGVSSRAQAIAEAYKRRLI